jgi:two-component system chemotaxis response regulator CheY
MTSVMIVENPEKPCLSAKKLLSSINYDIVFQTSNGYEAIEKYGILKPDLLLLDIVLSKHDGLSVLKELKNKYPESKIIITTMLPDKEILAECTKSGANACVTIPYKLKDFVTLVTSVCNSSKPKPKVAPIIIE